MEPQGGYHVPVMLSEVIESLRINPSGTYVDATFGGGGHSKAILKKLGKSGHLIAFDQDLDAKRNVPDDSRILFIPHNFRFIQRFLRLNKIDFVDGILADLGVSSFQINTADRGFSTRFEGELDMRMNQGSDYKASDVLNRMTADELQIMFQNYGEVTNAKTLAASIVQSRQDKPFQTLNDLNNVLRPLAKGNPQRYFAQVYQAIRIQVNDEMNALEEMMKQSAEILKKGGRIAIITFHSIEDRLVKNFFRFGNIEGIRETDVFGMASQPPLKSVHKKPLTPSSEEMKKNPRSRSAKLRVGEKT